ncbi:MAG TPA: PAS domain-containing protein [Candidatus Polarisedimenticolia bacterium]|nr:PAS domain-containing protein [Candidatus Polarisedimenticolia bacterium]
MSRQPAAAASSPVPPGGARPSGPSPSSSAPERRPLRRRGSLHRLIGITSLVSVALFGLFETLHRALLPGLPPSRSLALSIAGASAVAACASLWLGRVLAGLLRALEAEVGRREESELALRRSKEGLEAEVNKRNTELRRANAELRRQIAERKGAEQELEGQRLFLRCVLDTDPHLIFVKDWDGRFLLANKAVAEIYGTTVEGILGKTDADFNANAGEVQAFLQADRDVMSSGTSRWIDEEPVTDARTSRQRWFQTVKVPLPVSAGSPLRVLGVATDITHRKELEDRLLRRKEAGADPGTSRLLGEAADRAAGARARLRRGHPCAAEFQAIEELCREAARLTAD